MLKEMTSKLGGIFKYPEREPETIDVLIDGYVDKHLSVTVPGYKYSTLSARPTHSTHTLRIRGYTFGHGCDIRVADTEKRKLTGAKVTGIVKFARISQ